MKNLAALFTRLTNWTLYGLLLLSPLLVLPFTRNLIVDTKLLLIFVALFIVLITFAIKTLSEERWELAVSPLTFPLVMFGLAVLLSTLLTNKYPVEAFMSQGGALLVLVFVALFAGSLVKGDHTQPVVRVLGFSGALLSLSMLLQYSGWGPTRLINSTSSFELPHTLLFNLSGSSFVAIQVIVLALIGSIAWSVSRKTWAWPEILLGVINLVGLTIGVWSMLPGRIAQVVIPSLQASWTVLLRSLESWQSALIGQAPAAYANAYAQFKPLWTNGQVYWQTNFGTGTSGLFTLPVTLGLLGLLTWIFLLTQVIKQVRDGQKSARPLWWLLTASFVMQILLPLNLVVISIQMALLVFWVAANQSHFSLLQFKSVRLSTYPARLEFIKRFTSKNNWFISISAIILLLAAIGLGYGVGRAYSAYHFMYLANQALTAQDAIATYDNQRRAVALNPYIDSLRRDYALTNLQIALALANNAELTEEQQQQAVQLISQSIREGRAATILDPRDVNNWIALSQIYRTLIGAANEADTWAINSLANAVQVNPINPITRLEIGQLALGAGNAQEAPRYFLQAVQLKPALPIAYYQLGLAYQALNQLESAQAAWQRALELLPSTSDDYLTLSQQLDELAETIEASKGAGVTEEATTPDNTPNVTEQNVQQQESDIVTPGEDASL